MNARPFTSNAPALHQQARASMFSFPSTAPMESTHHTSMPHQKDTQLRLSSLGELLKAYRTRSSCYTPSSLTFSSASSSVHPLMPRDERRSSLPSSQHCYDLDLLERPGSEPPFLQELPWSLTGRFSSMLTPAGQPRCALRRLVP